ncbi:MAG: carboxypeptidase regulatory-like domain-containing protein, partial [Bryobacteraceae bacterium]|nr:carboxypeptidase regulatory-like domain-containing protein [Bryobacteraceae bacterium]
METMYSKCARIVAMLVCTIASLTSLAAQTPSLRGTVTDPSGASVPDAVITIRRAPNTQLQTKSDAAGAYVINNVPPGTFELNIRRPGFAPFTASGLNINGPVTLDAAMQITLEAQQVTVNDDSNTVSTDPTQNVGAIVLKGEDLEALSDDPDQLAQDLQALAGPAAGPNGGQIFIDGFSGGQLPPKANIREIRVNSNPFSAEYDRLGFGRIEIFTRPGSDKFRGQFLFMASDNVFNARNPFVTAEKPDFQSKFFDGNVSGPLSKKASFNFNVERRLIDENAVVNATILNSALQPERFNQAIITPNSRWNISPRIDYAINTNNTLVGRYSYSKVDDQNNGVGNFSLASRAYDNFSTGHLLQLTETAILSPKAINEFRLQYQKRNSGNDGDNTIPSINVQDSFQGGGAQVGLSRSNISSWEISNVASFTSGKHAWKFGGRVRVSDTSDSSPNNFGGTFTYAGVAQAPTLDANNNPV